MSGLRVSQETWWQVFHDPELDLLVQDALKQNLDIRQASARIPEIRSQNERFLLVESSWNAETGYSVS
ncbi:MAG: hypothetical protein HY788_17420 [Deltaproteobacteria bacterium]|nr:hypothetical protein [Deltaproteobacteria bacterium]